jgi:hypothetical protein
MTALLIGIVTFVILGAVGIAVIDFVEHEILGIFIYAGLLLVFCHLLGLGVMELFGW